MKVVFVLLALQQIAFSSSQLKLTQAEYKAFLTALDGRKPLFLQSAIPLAAVKNIKSDGKFLYWDIGGKYGTGKPTLVKPIYEDRQVGVSGDRSYGKPKYSSFGTFSPEQFASPSKAFNSGSFPPIYRNDVEHLMPVTKRPQQLVRRNKIRKRRQSEDDTDAATASTSTSTSTDDDEDYDEEEEEPLTYREELSFGLSTAGGVFGGAVGGYLDTTGQATLKLIGSLESLGLIAVTQFDSFLDRNEKEKEERRQRQKQTRYGPPPTYGVPAAPQPTYGAPNVQKTIVYSPPKLSYGVPQTTNSL